MYSSLRDDYVLSLFLYFLKLSLTDGQIDHALYSKYNKAGIKYTFYQRAGIRYPI